MAPCCLENAITSDDKRHLLGTSSPVQGNVQVEETIKMESQNDDVPQRRASFQRSALRDLRINQKKTFHILKEAARKAEKMSLTRNMCKREIGKSRKEGLASRAKENETKPRIQKVLEECLQCLASTDKRTSMATRIQAITRGYLCRKTCILKKKRRSLHRKTCSEITMSDFNDSFRSLGSLDLSPRTNMRVNEEYFMTNNNSFCLNSNSFTSTTWDESDLAMTLQDSSSTIFSTESTDVPVRLPSRKLSPTRPGMGAARLHSSCPSSYFPPMSPESSQRVENTSFDCLRSWLPTPELGNSSFSILSARDEPAKAPERSLSPLPPSKANA